LKHLVNLSLNNNSLIMLPPGIFSSLSNLDVLILRQNYLNNFSAVAESVTHLPKLTKLHLCNNYLTSLHHSNHTDLPETLTTLYLSVIFNKTFHSLKYLHILDLGGNKITYFEEAAFVGLVNLANFYLDGNNLKQIDSSKFKPFHATPEVLDLHGNQVSFSSKRTNSPFVNLTKLRSLKLDAQMPHGLNMLPYAFFRGLNSLQSLYLTDNHIFSFAADTFDDLTNLTFLSLDNSCAGVMQLQTGVFKNLRKLIKLSARNMGIQSFSKEVFGNLTELQILLLNQNVMQSLYVNVLEALPKLRYLDLRNIPLSCTCLNSDLQNWTLKNQRVQLVLLYKYRFATTTTVILLLTIIPLLYNKLYWKLKYSYYVFRSWFGQHWRRLREKEEHCKYNAFISYNSADEPWVLDQLLPNLEGNGASFRLCLHHRDFELGRNIVDNIVSAVYSSRKTICVVSRHFLCSEWCSLEIQLASYRLFHELRDVLLLIFLEPIPERQLSAYHRMRKVMLKKTYLQWPGSDCTDPAKAQELFWNHLRRALRSGSSRFEEEDEWREEYFNQPPTDDNNYYLMP
uniref:Toll-like receptor 21 n=1 Tax=Hucho hucho TaxID=62062 RepID=A0A4W5RRG1_9TELE